MEKFKQYLKEQKLLPRTVEEDVRNVTRFEIWLKFKRIALEEVKYDDLLSYIQYQQKQNVQPVTINLRLNSLRKYFTYLKQQEEITINPAKHLQVRGVIKQVIRNPLSTTELELLYSQYSQLKKQAHRQLQADYVHARNVVILGLLIWQGIHSGELAKMETTYINLNEGHIYIPSTTQSNSRQLPLSQKQIIALHHYLTNVRSFFRPKGHQLISGSTRNIMIQLVAQLQGLNPAITNALHIRASVILNWLKIHSKREVQYKAGHKHISSTEKYAEQELDGLEDQLSKHHPFG
jgi:site-specific recombinase XerD